MEVLPNVYFDSTALIGTEWVLVCVYKNEFVFSDKRS